jgi:hypothetical protein
MFAKDQEPTTLEKTTEKALQTLTNHATTSEEYAKILDQVVKLHKMQTEEKPAPVSKDTWLMVGANLLGILLIIRHEHLNVITSRAMNILPKLK